MNSLLSLKDANTRPTTKKEVRPDGQSGEELVLRPRATKRRAPRWREVAPAVSDIDVESRLRALAVQSSVLANNMAVALNEWLAFLQTRCNNPKAALQIMRELERLRRSAAEDLRETAGALERRPVEGESRVVEDDESAPRPQWPLTEGDLLNAYSSANGRS